MEVSVPIDTSPHTARQRTAKTSGHIKQAHAKREGGRRNPGRSRRF